MFYVSGKRKRFSGFIRRFRLISACTSLSKYYSHDIKLDKASVFVVKRNQNIGIYHTLHLSHVMRKPVYAIFEMEDAGDSRLSLAKSREICC